MRRQDRLGGHAHTHDIATADGRLLALDSGFLVHNTRTYPNLIRLFGELGVATQDTEMSMSVRCEGCGLEYAGSRGPLGLFPAVGSVARPEYLAALAAVPGFYRDARRLLASPGPEPLSLGEFLRQGGYRRYFVSHFVIPLVAAVWSCPPAEALAYPARYLFEFLDHHGMLRVARAPGWRTVTGGSRTYVEQIAKQLTTVAAGVPVRAIRPGDRRSGHPRRRRRHPSLRPGRGRHPPRRGAAPAGSAHRRRTGRPRGLPVHLQPGGAAHRRALAAPGPRRPARPGTTCCATARPRPRTCMSATT